jgi:hypothetical protein
MISANANGPAAGRDVDFPGAGRAFPHQTPDDVFITLRYAANLAAGHGPVYNIGERVEASPTLCCSRCSRCCTC